MFLFIIYYLFIYLFIIYYLYCIYYATAASIYGARLARHDLLRAIQRLAEKFHAWSPLETKKLHRLVEYINSTLDYRQYAFIGDDWSELELAIFVDADLASDKLDYNPGIRVSKQIDAPFKFCCKTATKLHSV
jgi:hypothetical protein